MKKTFALILALLYITASSGVVLNVHYCMGKISSVKVDNFNSSYCKCGKKQDKGSCCRSEVKVVKLNADQKATVSSFDFNKSISILPTPVSLINALIVDPRVVSELVANAPPPLLPAKLYLRNSVFRI